ncbi:hypothetical protein Anas_00571 [Armadillidium nasatum]|uniref:Uncharacterized protein n=1 Tax=Armadillidium nasatum TaxID=96803 RepID=A0A5N5SZ10_9CRUS|nr:hypothetical protein Anas_00571 [Armadillidium nasatum]
MNQNQSAENNSLPVYYNPAFDGQYDNLTVPVHQPINPVNPVHQPINYENNQFLEESPPSYDEIFTIKINEANFNKPDNPPSYLQVTNPQYFISNHESSQTEQPDPRTASFNKSATTKSYYYSQRWSKV